MTARSKARKRALDVLYEADLRDIPAETVLSERHGRDESPVPKYTSALVHGVVDHRARIDELISSYAVDWTIERMPPVDRNVLRLGLYELLWIDDVPDGVVISEAVELARSLSTEESPRFINGVLARLAEARPALDGEPVPSVGEGAPGVGGEHAPGDELLGELAGRGVVDDGE
jgi:N utilization substance protein B